MTGSRFAAALTAAIAHGFEAQAAEHGRAIHAEAVARRARDPLAVFLQDTFARQVRDYGGRAVAARDAGDRHRAMELATACERAAENLRRVQGAVEGIE